MYGSVDLAWLQSQFPDVASLTFIGRGGQKIVLAGHHPVDGPVVVKIFGLFSERDRVHREIEAATLIRSPRIPKILAQGTLWMPLGQHVWIREQRIPGQSLRSVLSSRPLDFPATARIGLDVLEALVAAEERRIVHRDVKPDNIMIDPQGDSWLLDFGLARYLDRVSLTATAQRSGVGTAGYAPPEQFLNKKTEIDSRADLFGLGVTLYECIEGVNPYRHGAVNDDEILKRVATAPLPRIARPVDKHGKFVDFVGALTQGRKVHRPASCVEAFAWMKEIFSENGLC